MSLATKDIEPGVLATARYGKDKVRVFRVVRGPESKVHNVVEYNVTLLVEGAIETRCAESRPLRYECVSRYFLFFSWVGGGLHQLHARGQ